MAEMTSNNNTKKKKCTEKKKFDTLRKLYTEVDQSDVIFKCVTDDH